MTSCASRFRVWAPINLLIEFKYVIIVHRPVRIYFVAARSILSPFAARHWDRDRP